MRNYSGDAAEQVVRMSLEGTEMAVKLAGKGAERLAVLLFTVLKDQKRTKGRLRLTSMLRSGKELKVFSITDRDLPKFCAEAKKYGVLYTVLKDRDVHDGQTDLMVRAEDSSKINRIFERFKLAAVDMGTVKSEIEQQRQEAAKAILKDAAAQPEPPLTTKDKIEEFLNEVLKAAPAQEQAQTPKEGRAMKSRQSAPSSGTRSTTGAPSGKDDPERRPSVKQQLEDIRKEQRQKAQTKGRKEPQRYNQHKAPKKKAKTKPKVKEVR